MTPEPENSTMSATFRSALSRPVSAYSVAVFRIALGALLLVDCWRFLRQNRIHRYFVEPEFHFTYPGFGWVVPLSEQALYLAWLGMGVAAILVMIGLFYRASIVVLTVLFSYFFLLERAEYLNHFYLVILFLILLCFIPAHRALSIDARLWPRSVPGDVQYAAVFILRAQMEIMLVFAGLVKITPDWLAGEPLGMWLRARADNFSFGFIFQYDWVIIAGTWGTIALHVLGAPLLLWRRTRFAVFLVYCVFHSANAVFFNIGIFPWLTIAATTIFFAPDWPRQLAARLKGVPTADTVERTSPMRLSNVTIAGMVLWLTVQVALPLRAGLFRSDVRWTGEGHEFSWRMRIFDRKADGVFIVAADGQEWVVDPKDHLTRRQAQKMLVRPDMIHQFAGHLKDFWLDMGYREVTVRAEIMKSLNGRPKQPYVDPTVDLAAVPFRHFGTDNWVLPMKEWVWGVADNRAASPGGVPSDQTSD